MAKHVDGGAARTITKTFTVKGQRKRARVPVYDRLDDALRELGAIRVLKDVNDMSIQRVRWSLASDFRMFFCG